MLLTYGISADIPKKLSIFYNQAYEALFQRHDAIKGGFQRDRHCDLDIQDFSRVFSAFCILTLDKRLFQFSRSDAISYLGKAKDLVNITVNSEDFLEDLLQSICLLVEDGLLLVFAHRSFQEYFSAKFICDAVPEVQRKLINRFTENFNLDSIIKILYELSPDLVEREFIIPNLKGLFEILGVKRKVGITHSVKYFRLDFDEIFVSGDVLTLSTVHAKSRIHYHPILHFVLNGSGKYSAQKEFRENKIDRDKFLKKYFPNDKKRYLTSKLTHRSPIVLDMMSSNLWINFMQRLNTIHKILKELERKHERVVQSLDRLLSG